MALYAIGDLHLSLGADKPMDAFGGNWVNYVEKIREGFSALGDEDLTVLCGDLSWGMSLEESAEDFRFIEALPGRKLIVKGNHDYWWTTVSKLKSFFEKNGLHTLDVLHNNCFFYGETALCGTRGWFCEEERGDEHDRKILNREVYRLKASLDAAGDAGKLCFLHYPPIYNDYFCAEIATLLENAGVTDCCYGHIHGMGQKFAFQGTRGGVRYRMVSADYLNFRPLKLLE